MRFVFPLLVALLAVAAPATAAPLVGSVDGGPVQLLDRDLRPQPGAFELPEDTDATVLSPNGRRIAAVDFESGAIVIADRETGGAQTVREVGAGPDVYWPSRHHVVALVFDGVRTTTVTSFDLRRGTQRTTRVRGGVLSDHEQRGTRVRLLIRGGILSFPNGRNTVVDIGAGGAVKRRTRVRRPKRFGKREDFSVRLSGGLLLASSGRHHALLRVGGKRRRVRLPGGYYDWVGPRLVWDGRTVARVDRRRLRIVKRVRIPASDSVVPYGRGFVVGFGRARYNRKLRRVTSNPDPALTQANTLVAKGRIYDHLHDCEGSGQAAGVAIADARTGRRLGTAAGDIAYGVLGDGYLRISGSDDICD